MGQDRKLDLKVPSFEWSFFFLSLFLFVVGSPYIRSQITTQTKLYTKGIHARVYIQPPLLSLVMFRRWDQGGKNQKPPAHLLWVLFLSFKI